MLFFVKEAKTDETEDYENVFDHLDSSFLQETEEDETLKATFKF